MCVFSVIYLSLDQPDEALEAYKQALALEPNNENYKQSVKICEDRLNSLGRTTAGATGVCKEKKQRERISIYYYLGSRFSTDAWLLIWRRNGRHGWIWWFGCWWPT